MQPNRRPRGLATVLFVVSGARGEFYIHQAGGFANSWTSPTPDPKRSSSRIRPTAAWKREVRGRNPLLEPISRGHSGIESNPGKELPPGWARSMIKRPWQNSWWALKVQIGVGLANSKHRPRVSSGCSKSMESHSGQSSNIPTGALSFTVLTT